MRKIFAIMLIFILAVSAEDYVVINSQDGRDVLSGIYYANVKQLPVKFMPSSGCPAGTFAIKTGVDHEIFLVQSSSIPVSGFLETELKSRNHTLEIYSTTDGEGTNLHLAERSGATRFVIVDSAYSDSALSVLPYAAKKGAYVILADKYNIESVEEIVENAEEITIYGLVDQEVKDALATYQPVTIGKGEDKYVDNVEIVKKTMDEYGDSQIIIADGSFVEEGMASGDFPILFSGRLVPTVTYNLMKDGARSGDLGTVLLIGENLMMPVYDAREKIERELEYEGINESFGITVKFGQVIPSAGTSVMELDKFYLPSYYPELNISEMVYNKASDKLMITVDNTGEGSAYYIMDVHVYVDGSELTVFGISETKLIERGDKEGEEFDLDISSIEEGNVTATVVVKFGSAKASLDSYVSASGPLEEIVYADESNVSADYAHYDKADKVLSVTIRNNGEVDAYVKPEVLLMLGGEEATIRGTGTRELEPNSLFVEEFPVELTDEDLQANQNITVNLQYGARAGFLVKEGTFMLPLAMEEFPWLLILLLIVIAVAAYLIKKRMESGRK